MLFVLFVALVLTSVLMYRRMSLAERELVELRRIAGYYRVEDERLLYAATIETNDPLSWGWRVYLPAGHKYTWHYYSGEIPPNGFPKNFGTFGDGATRTGAVEDVVYLSLRKNLNDQWVLNLMQESKGSKISTSSDVTDEVVSQIRNAKGRTWECLGNGRSESRKVDGPIVLLRCLVIQQANGVAALPPDKPASGIMLWLETAP